MKAQKPNKKTFHYKNYKCQVVALYHHEMSLEAINDWAMKTDPELLEHKERFEDWESTTACVYPRTTSGRIYILMGPYQELTIATLAHECVHITSELFNRIDTDFTQDTEEQFAYTVDSIFEDIYKFLLLKTKINKDWFLMLPTTPIIKEVIS